MNIDLAKTFNKHVSEYIAIIIYYIYIFILKYLLKKPGEVEELIRQQCGRWHSAVRGDEAFLKLKCIEWGSGMQYEMSALHNIFQEHSYFVK